MAGELLGNNVSVGAETILLLVVFAISLPVHLVLYRELWRMHRQLRLDRAEHPLDPAARRRAWVSLLATLALVALLGLVFWLVAAESGPRVAGFACVLVVVTCVIAAAVVGILDAVRHPEGR